jgi:hypothetical protein
MFEHIFDKKVDFSVQFHIDDSNNINHIGFGYFKTNENGMYDSNLINHKIPFLSELELLQLAKDIQDAIYSSDIYNNYTGYLGVDCMIYQDENKKLKIHPCLEINLRYNMGTLAIELGKHINMNSKAEIKIYFDPNQKFSDFDKYNRQIHRLEVNNNKIESGYLALSNPEHNLNFGAYLLAKK